MLAPLPPRALPRPPDATAPPGCSPAGGSKPAQPMPQLSFGEEMQQKRSIDREPAYPAAARAWQPLAAFKVGHKVGQLLITANDAPDLQHSHHKSATARQKLLMLEARRTTSTGACTTVSATTRRELPCFPASYTLTALLGATLPLAPAAAQPNARPQGQAQQCESGRAGGGGAYYARLHPSGALPIGTHHRCGAPDEPAAAGGRALLCRPERCGQSCHEGCDCCCGGAGCTFDCCRTPEKDQTCCKPPLLQRATPSRGGLSITGEYPTAHRLR